MRKKRKYLCDWCGCYFDDKEALLYHKQISHNDFNASGELKKLNREIMADDKNTFKIEESIKPKPISGSEVKRIVNADLSDLTSMEILMRLDQGDQWREEIKLLDLAKKTGVMCRKEIETTEGKKITYDWEYFKENEEAMLTEINKLNKEKENDTMVRNNISKRNGGNIRRKGSQSKKQPKEARNSNITNNQ